MEIRMLGRLERLRDEQLLELPPSKKARARLAYMVATERPHSRDILANML